MGSLFETITPKEQMMSAIDRLSKPAKEKAMSLYDDICNSLRRK